MGILVNIIRADDWIAESMFISSNDVPKECYIWVSNLIRLLP